MRYNNQLTVEKLTIGNLSRMSAIENCEVSSENSGSAESINETNNNNNTTMNWSISKPELGLSRITKSFAVLCEGESRIAASGKDLQQAAPSR